MSKVTTVYNKLLEIIPTLFPNKTRIPNSDSLIDNPHTFMRDGWALRVDNQTYQPSEFCIMETVRTFAVLFTSEVLRTDSQTTQSDTAKTGLLENVYAIQKDFYNIDRLGIPYDIARVELGGTSGTLDLKQGKNNFIYVEVYFNIHIRETL